jgi:hypothetical protein
MTQILTFKEFVAETSEFPKSKGKGLLKKHFGMGLDYDESGVPPGEKYPKVGYRRDRNGIRK